MKKYTSFVILILSSISFINLFGKNLNSFEFKRNAPIVFNVKDYGATGDSTTDDTQAIQLTIQACYDAGGGDVYFPNGIYNIGGPLQTNVNGVNPNSQLYIPPCLDISGFSKRVHIRFIGQSRPNWTTNGTILPYDFLVYSRRGTIIKSTITGSGTAPAIFGGTDIQSDFGVWNYNNASFENLTLVTKNSSTGPTVGGINGRDIGSIECDNIAVITDVSNWQSPNATQEVAGIITAKNAGESMNSLRNTLISGFKYGVVLGEHCVLDQLNVMACTNAITLSGAGHPTYGGRVAVHWCKNTIYIPNSLILGMGQILETTFNIEQLAVETINNGSWYDYSKMLVDSGNHGHGYLNYNIYAMGGALNNDAYSKYKGDYVYATSIYDSKNNTAVYFPDGGIQNEKTSYAGRHIFLNAGTNACTYVMNEYYPRKITALNSNFPIKITGGGIPIILSNGETVNELLLQSYETVEFYSPDKGFHYVQTGASNGIQRNSYLEKSVNYIISPSDNIINYTSGTYTTTLPTAVNIKGRSYIIKNSGSGIVTIATTNNQTIDGNSMISLNPLGSAQVVSNGVNWVLLFYAEAFSPITFSNPYKR